MVNLLSDRFEVSLSVPLMWLEVVEVVSLIKRRIAVLYKVIILIMPCTAWI